jgi:hypothetical protein
MVAGGLKHSQPPALVLARGQSLGRGGFSGIFLGLVFFHIFIYKDFTGFSSGGFFNP